MHTHANNFSFSVQQSCCRNVDRSKHSSSSNSIFPFHPDEWYLRRGRRASVCPLKHNMMVAPARMILVGVVLFFGFNREEQNRRRRRKSKQKHMARMKLGF